MGFVFFQKTAISRFSLTNRGLGGDTFPYKGTDSLSFAGFGRLLASLWQIDDPLKILALTNSLLSVQIASALGGTQIPDERNEELISVGSSLYSGVPRKMIPDMQSKLEVVIDGLFAIAPDIPVTEFVTAFDTHDINRLRRYITEIADNTANLEEAAEIAKKYNTEAKRFDSRQELLRNLDLIGLLISLASMQTGSNVFVPPTTWISESLRWVLRKEKSGMAASILDVFDSMGKTKDPRSVLVARMRRELQKLQ